MKRARSLLDELREQYETAMADLVADDAACQPAEQRSDVDRLVIGWAENLDGFDSA